MTMRLSSQPGEEIDRERSFTFSWNGRTIPAYAGDTIVSALAATGQRVFSRSYKYHRPRGVLTASYLDPGCFFQVADEPNVRGAHRQAEPGMDVHSQNTWPSLSFDLKAANQLAGRFLGPGFYYKTFIRPRRLWPFYERILQRFVHAGEVSADTPRITVDKRYAHPDVLVAGGGPAGMAAATAAAQAGARVMLVEEEHRLGGHLRWGGAPELAALRELRDLVAAAPGIEVLTDSVVTGRYDDNWTAVVRRGLPGAAEQLIKARAKILVVAPGLIERPYVFQGNDVPGVMLATAVRRLIKLHAVKPGERAVVLTANAGGDAAVADLRQAGVEIAQVVDARTGGDIVRVHGHRGVRAVEVAGGARIECDLVVTAVGWTAPTALLNMAGDQPGYNPRAARFFPRSLPSNVLVAGGIAGDGSRDELIGHAQAVGREAAGRRRCPPPQVASRRAGLQPTASRRVSPSFPSMPTRNCSAPAPTAWWTSAKTCPRRTSSPRSGKATTRSSWLSAIPPPRWARPRASSNWSTRSRSRPKPSARPSRKRAPPPGARPMPPSRSARWPAGHSNPCGTPRCSPGTRRTMRAR